ncbi:TATA element modulatory factor 1 DNA binding domain-containing protein [Ditylenchus destructor]|uniref:TATA element modulatory factor 1 DNA binding domain-containing protein n=1 Tax=Ditylenchus destructor TaxID=166010 RepID=A0AAD4MXT1_9BILA|nr:TATA element modulatory factor 1 DNA binding domain-containing protein [Ditylenchus destructor]
MSSSNQPCSNLQNQLAACSFELKACRKGKSDLEDASRDLSARLRMAELKVKRSVQSNFGLNLELQESKTKLELSENAIAEARKESRELSEKTSKLEAELEQLRKHEMELRQQNAELRSQNGESERQIQQLKQKLTESEAAISRLEADKLPEATAVSQGLKHRTPVLRSKKLSSPASVNEEPAESQSDIECRTSISRTLEPSSSPSPDSAMHLKSPKIMTPRSDWCARRSPRNRVKPLNFWANQTVVYKYNENGLPEARGVTEIKIDGRQRSQYSSFTKYKIVKNEQ